MAHRSPLERRRNIFNWGKLHWPGAAEKLDAREAAPAPAPAPANGVSTIVSVVYVTQSKTFDGPAVYVTLGSPLVNSRTTAAAPTTASDDDEEDVTSTQASTQATATSNGAKNTSGATTSAPQTTAAATTGTSKSTGTAASIAGAASATASVAPSAGMSGGVKAALVLGLLIGIALVLGFILWIYKGKKRQAAMRRLSDEKSSYNNNNPRSEAFRPATSGGASVHSAQAAPSIVVDAPPAFGGANSARGSTATDTAPRLELRPITQFSPILANAPKNSGWERPGANAANDPSNPFGNHAETVENGAAAAAGSPVNRKPVDAQSPPRGPPAQEVPVPPGFKPSGPDSPKPLSVKSNASGTPADVSANEAGVPGGPAGAAAMAVAGAAVSSGGLRSQGPPPPGPPGVNNVHRVQMDFNPSMEDELRIRNGQLVRMLHEYDDGWALCVRMDRSQQGVVPRTCLSKYPVKPRPGNGPPSGGPPPAPYRNYGNGPSGAPPSGPPPPGPGPMMRGPPPPGAAPRPLSPAQNRPMTPQGHPPYPMGPNQGRPQSPAMHRPSSPAGPQYIPQQQHQMQGQQPLPAPQRPHAAGPQQRSRSPGPYGPQGRPQMGPDMRRRSNSMGQIQTQNLPKKNRMTPPSPLSAGPVLSNTSPVEAPTSEPKLSPVTEGPAPGAVPARKPVPGQAL